MTFQTLIALFQEILGTDRDTIHFLWNKLNWMVTEVVFPNNYVLFVLGLKQYKGKWNIANNP